MAESMDLDLIPDIALLQLDAGYDDGGDIVFDYGDRRISMSFRPSSTA